MGTKFANLHIKTIDKEVVVEALQKLSNKTGSNTWQLQINEWFKHY